MIYNPGISYQKREKKLENIVKYMERAPLANKTFSHPPVILASWTTQKENFDDRNFCLYILVLEKYLQRENSRNRGRTYQRRNVGFIVFKDGGAEIVEDRRKSMGRIWLASESI